LLLFLQPGLSRRPARFPACRRADSSAPACPAHGRVEHVVAVLVAQLGQAGGDFAVALLLLFRQANTGEFKITQRVVDRFFLRGIQRGVMIAIAQVAVRFVQTFMLPNRCTRRAAAGFVRRLRAAPGCF
jgi:hypothetical protein